MNLKSAEIWAGDLTVKEKVWANGMSATSLVGFLAAICTTTAYIPQAVRAWRTRSTHDLSLKMYVIMTTGTALWLLYGVINVDWPLIAANTVSLGLTVSILFLKFRHG